MFFESYSVWFYFSGMVMTGLESLSERVIGAVFEVSRVLGAGFLEKVYERALVRELEMRGMRVQRQVPLPVSYKGELVGEYFADLMVEDELLVELKCVELLNLEHRAQCLNYLRASGRNVCLLVNFQRARVQVKRVVLDFEAVVGFVG